MDKAQSQPELVDSCTRLHPSTKSSGAAVTQHVSTAAYAPGTHRRNLRLYPRSI